MATSVQRYKGYGFWINDFYLEVLYMFLINEISSLLSKESVLSDELITGLKGYYSGAVDLNIDKFNNYEIKCLEKGLESIYKKFHLSMNEISTQTLNQNRGKILNSEEDYFPEGGIQSKIIAKTAKMMIDLLNGNWKIKPSDKVSYW